MYCSKCGKEYGGEAMTCPYCGANNQQGVVYNYQVQEKYNVCAIVGFVLSLVSLVFSLWGILPLAALIVSAVGVKQTKERNEKGSGHAIAGVVIGAVCLLFALIVAIFSAH